MAMELSNELDTLIGSSDSTILIGSNNSSCLGVDSWYVEVILFGSGVKKRLFGFSSIGVSKALKSGVGVVIVSSCFGVGSKISISFLGCCSSGVKVSKEVGVLKLKFNSGALFILKVFSAEKALLPLTLAGVLSKVLKNLLTGLWLSSAGMLDIISMLFGTLIVFISLVF